MKKDDILKNALQSLGVPADEVSKIMASDEAEVDFTMPEGNFYTPGDLTTRDEAVKKEARKEAGKAAIEIAVKEARRERGLEFEGKTIENLLKAQEAKVLADAKIEPEKKVQELTTANDALRQQIANFDTEKADLEGKLNSQKLDYQFDSAVASGLSDVTLKDGWTPGYVSQIFRADYEPSFEEGQIVLKDKKTGTKVLNQKTQLPEAPENVLKSFVTEKGMIGTPRPGRGGKGTPPAGGGQFSNINNLEDFNAYCDEHNINPEGLEGDKLLGKIRTENKNFKAE